MAATAAGGGRSLVAASEEGSGWPPLKYYMLLVTFAKANSRALLSRRSFFLGAELGR